jgi:hypothetical protein
MSFIFSWKIKEEQYNKPLLTSAICQVAGIFAGVQSGSAAAADPSKWRELRDIPGVSPSTPHHSLVIEPRQPSSHREFVVFHGNLIYPEYLLVF